MHTHTFPNIRIVLFQQHDYGYNIFCCSKSWWKVRLHDGQYYRHVYRIGNVICGISSWQTHRSCTTFYQILCLSAITKVVWKVLMTIKFGWLGIYFFDMACNQCWLVWFIKVHKGYIRQIYKVLCIYREINTLLKEWICILRYKSRSKFKITSIFCTSFAQKIFHYYAMVLQP